MVEEHSRNDEIRGGYNKEEEIEREKLTERAEGEAKKSLEIAKNMLNLKIDINTISASTGLSLNELKRISL